MNNIRKGAMLGLFLLIMFGVVNHAHAQHPVQKTDVEETYNYPEIPSGKLQQIMFQLLDVEATGNGPTNEGRYEYTITMRLDEMTLKMRLWMKESEYQEFRGAIAFNVILYYYWVDGRMIYEKFKW